MSISCDWAHFADGFCISPAVISGSKLCAYVASAHLQHRTSMPHAASRHTWNTSNRVSSTKRQRRNNVILKKSGRLACSYESNLALVRPDTDPKTPTQVCISVPTQKFVQTYDFCYLSSSSSCPASRLIRSTLRSPEASSYAAGLYSFHSFSETTGLPVLPDMLQLSRLEAEDGADFEGVLPGEAFEGVP
jgi:hypothetical protein